MNQHLSTRPPRTSRLNRFRQLCSPLLLAAGLATAGCGHKLPPPDEGPGTPETLAVNSFQQQWTTRLGTDHGSINRVVARENLVFAYTEDGTSFVLDRASGRMLHAETVRNGSKALHPPVVLKDYIVYPTTTSLEIYGKDGALLNSKELNYSIRSDAVGHRNYVYMGADFSNGGRVVCVDVTDRYLDHRWYLMFPGVSISATPTIVGDIVYVAGENNDIAAVTYDTREPVWPLPNGVFRTYGSIVADLAGDESGIYAASTDTKLYALNRNNGRVKWQFFAATVLRNGPVISKDLVFQMVPGTGLVAIDKIELPDKTKGPQYNRTPRWTASDAKQFLAEDDKHVYIQRADNAIVALDKTNGAAAFVSRRHDFTAFWSNPKDGTIFAATAANRVLSISPVLKPGVVGEVVFAPVSEERPTIAAAR